MKHRSIRSTCEMQENYQVQFLDTLITYYKGAFHTRSYRKPTFTSPGRHFLIYIPYSHKINIKTLITRFYNLCNNWLDFHDKIIFLKKIFATDKYPLFLFDKITKKYVAKYSYINTLLLLLRKTIDIWNYRIWVV